MRCLCCVLCRLTAMYVPRFSGMFRVDGETVNNEGVNIEQFMVKSERNSEQWENWAESPTLYSLRQSDRRERRRRYGHTHSRMTRCNTHCRGRMYGNHCPQGGASVGRSALGYTPMGLGLFFPICNTTIWVRGIGPLAHSFPSTTACTHHIIFTHARRRGTDRKKDYLARIEK